MGNDFYKVGTACGSTVHRHHCEETRWADSRVPANSGRAPDRPSFGFVG